MMDQFSNMYICIVYLQVSYVNLEPLEYTDGVVSDPLICVLI